MMNLLIGDAIEVLKTLPEKSIRCCVTSPPYYNLRDYGHEKQIGKESHPKEYIGRLVDVFREVRRVLTDDGTLWLNLGDCYAGAMKFTNLNSDFNARYGNASGAKKQEVARKGIERARV